MYDKTAFFCVSSKSAELALILNSTMGHYLAESFADKLDSGGYMMKKESVESFPIPEINEELSKVLAQKYNTIISISTVAGYQPKAPPEEQLALEAEIDELVFELYELTDEERQLVRDSVN